jgi:restriction system protein
MLRARHVETLQEEAARKTSEVHATVEAMQSLLVRTITDSPIISFELLKVQSDTPAFSPGTLADDEPEPQLEAFLPPPATGIGARLPHNRRKQQALADAAHARFEEARSLHAQRRRGRLEALAAAEAEFRGRLAAAEAATQQQHAEVDDLERRFTEDVADAVVDYLGAVVSALPLPYDAPAEPRVAFSPDSHQLIVELELPTVDVIPSAR